MISVVDVVNYLADEIVRYRLPQVSTPVEDDDIANKAYVDAGGGGGSDKFTLGNAFLSNFASNRVTSCYGSDTTVSPYRNGQMSLPFDVKLVGFTVTFDTALGSSRGLKLVENGVIPGGIIGTIPSGVNFVSITLDETITANTPFGFTTDNASSISGRNPTWIYEIV